MQVNWMFLREHLDVWLSGLCYFSASQRPQRPQRSPREGCWLFLRASVRSLAIGRSLVPARLNCGSLRPLCFFMHR